MPSAPKNLRQIESLVEIVAQLRGPEGCPWDKEQTHQSLTQYAIEETHELVEAIESSSPKKDELMKEELGDVLFQVVLHSQLAAERGAFTFDDVIETLSRKMVRRHPHVFTQQKAADSAEVIRNWEEIKKQEKAAAGNTTFSLNVPPLPALQRAYKIGLRTHKLQFDWNNAEEVMVKVEEELDEMREALDEGAPEAIRDELGDVFFSLAQLSRHLDLDPEQVLRQANRKFEDRFHKMIELSQKEGKDFSKLNTDEKEDLWKRIK